MNGRPRVSRCSPRLPLLNLRPTQEIANRLGLVNLSSLQQADSTNTSGAEGGTYAEQMRNVGNFISDLGAGFVKGIPNAITETAGMVYQGWGYIGANTVIRPLESFGFQPEGAANRAIEFYAGINGRAFIYENGVQEFGGIVGGFVGPSSPLRGVAVTQDLAALRLSNAIRGTYDDIFITAGLDTRSHPHLLNSPVAQTLRTELANGGMPASILDRQVNQILQSGTDLPTMRTASTGEFFYKVEPVGSNTQYWSTYWMDSSQYARLAGRNAMEIGDMLGLPAKSAAGGGLSGWRISEITPRSGQSPVIFDSTIAPASQGQWVTKALDRQTIIANPNQWSVPRPVATVPAIKR